MHKVRVICRQREQKTSSNQRMRPPSSRCLFTRYPAKRCPRTKKPACSAQAVLAQSSYEILYYSTSCARVSMLFLVLYSIPSPSMTAAPESIPLDPQPTRSYSTMSRTYPLYDTSCIQIYLPLLVFLVFRACLSPIQFLCVHARYICRK